MCTNPDYTSVGICIEVKSSVKRVDTRVYEQETCILWLRPRPLRLVRVEKSVRKTSVHRKDSWHLVRGRRPLNNATDMTQEDRSDLADPLHSVCVFSRLVSVAEGDVTEQPVLARVVVQTVPILWGERERHGPSQLSAAVIMAIVAVDPRREVQQTGHAVTPPHTHTHTHTHTLLSRRSKQELWLPSVLFLPERDGPVTVALSFPLP